MQGRTGPSSAPTARESNLVRLLDFARVLQDVSSFEALLEASRVEVEAKTGYAHTWLRLHDDTEADPFLAELLSSHSPVVIPDARLDPRTDKVSVERLHNRTLINIPLSLLEAPFGVFGVGTFGDEGCRVPSSDELSYLVGMASLISVAASRIRWHIAKAQADRERAALERRLAQVQKLESLGLLAGGIAHDFNNLLTVIIASANLAEELSEDEELKGEVKQVLDAAERAAALTRQLLAMSRAQELSLRPIDVNELLRQLLLMLRRILPENVAVDLIEGRSLPLVEADRSQLDQVFMNLLINARDAMPAGGKVTIETEQVLVNGHYAETHPWAKPGRYVLVTVTDTGTGMDRQVLDRIFEPFFTTKAPKAGTGLGLAVSYGIVRQHEGMLHCYSEVGVGTSFKVYLPAAQRLATSVGTKLQVKPSGGVGRVLVAEDDDAVRAVVIRILERSGYEVTGVAHGNAACLAVSAAPFDVVLMDVVMPGLACRDAVQYIRSAAPHARILLSSGYTAGEAVARLVEQTGLEILRKPYDPDQLLRAVRAAIEGGQPQ